MINVKIGGNAIEVLDTTKVKLEKLTPFLNKAAAYQERSTKMNFLKKSDPDGNGWAKLSPRTLKTKKSGAILRETSALIGSISSTVSGESAFITAGQAYGRFHQTGTRKMPQRKFLGIGAKDREKINEMAKEMLFTL